MRTALLDLAVYRRSATDEDQCSLPYGNAVTIRREHYPGVQVSIIHPDSEPPLIVCEKVGGSIPSIIFQTKCTSVWRCILLGADDEIRIFESLAITGLQLVKFLSTHKHEQKSHSFATFAKFRCIRASYFHPCSDKTEHPESSLIVELFCPFQSLTERHRRVHRRHERGYAAAADIHCIFSQRT